MKYFIFIFLFVCPFFGLGNSKITNQNLSHNKKKLKKLKKNSKKNNFF